MLVLLCCRLAASYRAGKKWCSEKSCNLTAAGPQPIRALHTGCPCLTKHRQPIRGYNTAILWSDLLLTQQWGNSADFFLSSAFSKIYCIIRISLVTPPGWFHAFLTQQYITYLNKSTSFIHSFIIYCCGYILSLQILLSMHSRTYSSLLEFD